MSRDWRFFIAGMADMCAQVRLYSNGLSKQEFLEKRLVYDVILRNLELMGEAVKHVPAEVRAAMPEVDWRKLCGMRDILAHQYFRLDGNMLWDTVTVVVPAIQEALGRFTANRDVWGLDVDLPAGRYLPPNCNPEKD